MNDGVTTVSPPAALIRLQDVTKRYPGMDRPAVDRFTLDVRRSEVLALLGPSACGKSTVLRLVAGFERPDAGSVTLGDRPVSDLYCWIPPESRGVGMVFQDYALFPHLTVWDNVGFGLRRMSKVCRDERVGEALRLVDLAAVAGRHPHELSGGQQQRVALARALAPNPVVVLLDEPFSNLDAELRVQTRDEVRRILKAAQATAVFVTHDQEDAFAIADRVAVMRDGALEQAGSAEEIYTRPATRFVAEFVGRAVFLPAMCTAAGVETELGWLRCTCEEPEGPVDLVVRPGEVALEPDDDGAAVVVGRQYRGTEVLYAVRLASGRVVSALRPASPLLPLESRVRVSLSCREPYTFPRDGSRPSVHSVR